MKTAEEWSSELGVYWVHCQGADEPCYKITPQQVSNIQADALRHAVSKCAKYGPNAERLLKAEAEKLEAR